jgi:lysophospholipase L1-like esterase
VVNLGASLSLGKWKLVQYRKAKKGKGAAKSDSNSATDDDWRLYDLSSDIGEENDLAAQYPEVVRRIRDMLKRDGLEGGSPQASSVEGKGQAKSVVVALIGDSTVTDSAGWGKAFAKGFDEQVKVVNFSAGGRSSKSWYDEGRLPAVETARPDYLLIQFGHNGQPGKGPARETDPATSYRDYLKIYIDKARAIGAVPIIVSPVTRRRFDETGQLVATLKPWADAARSVADETATAFIDLHSRSVAYHNRIGAKASEAFSPKQGDYTHFNQQGAQAIAGMIVEDLQRAEPKLASHVK